MPKAVPAQPFNRLVLDNVRCFRHAEIPLDNQMTVILGENGSGKSTVIEALASLNYTAADEGFTPFPLRHDTKSGRIALYQQGRKAAVANLFSASVQRNSLPEDSYILAYGRYRRVFIDDGEDRQESSSPVVLLDNMAARAAADRAVTLNRPDNNLLRDISLYLIALNYGRNSDPRLERVWNRLVEGLPILDPRLAGLQLIERNRKTVAAVIRNGIPLELPELSDGYQSLLVIIFDLALRYPYLFLSLDDPLLGRAVVAIDEIDLHLHARWQRTVLSQLVELFPNTQFIVTTHSAVVVQNAIDTKRTVVSLKESRNAVSTNVLNERALRELRGAEVGSLLLENKLFGVKSRYSTRITALERRTDELQKRVEEGTATEDDYRKLKRALDTMEELAFREDRRRADTSTVAQMAKLEAAFVKDLVEELKTARS